MVTYREISTYEMSGGVNCLYFKDGFANNNKAYFNTISNRRTFRNLVGIKTKRLEDGEKTTIRYWHFGIQAKPIIYPYLAFIIKPHVLFSEDGENIWESKQRLHSARRSQCKNWWNPEWRDRILASMDWLSDRKGNIEIELGENISINISNKPIIFSSPVSFKDPKTVQPVLDEFDGKEDDLVDGEGYDD